MRYVINDILEFMDNIKGCLQSLLVIVVVIGGLAFLSFVHRSCMGAVAQILPDDGEYAVTDDDYYHRKHCSCVNEDNFADWIDVETAIDEGFKPCSYCNPPTEESEDYYE